MEDVEKEPLEFSNRVIRMFADHLVGKEDLKPQDYTVVRVTFRKLGGSWFELCHGNVPHILLMAQVIRAWGKN